MTSLGEDFRHAFRRLRGAPGFTALAILTLALGIGAHVAVFSLVDVLFLRPLPLPHADRLVGLYESRAGEGFFPLSLPDYLDYRRESTVWSGLAAHYPAAPLSLRTPRGSEEINGSVVSADYFSVLGVEPARGRFFLPREDATPGAGPVAVVSYELWQSRLGGREDVVGRALSLNGEAFTVVGVAPEGFRGVLLGLPSEVWIPTSMARVGYRWCDASSRDCTWLNLIGRLAPERTIDAARAQMALLSRRLRQAHPSGEGPARGVRLAPLGGVHPAARPEVLRLAGLLLAAVTLLLLVAVANLGGLLVARTLPRRPEIALRLALGASRGRVVRLLAAESLLLSFGGGAAGLLVATWLGRLVALLYPSSAPLDLGLRASALGYAALLSLGCGLAVALVAALGPSRGRLAAVLRGETATGSRKGARGLGLFVVVQVALSFVLLTSAGLLARSFATVSDGGSVDPASIATLRLRPRLVGYGPEKAQAFTRRVVRRLEALPGVRSVSLARGFAPWLYGEKVRVGRPADGGDLRQGAWIDEVAPRYFETNGIALVQGRELEEGDRAGRPPVAIVNRTLARALWPEGEAVGELLVIGDRTFAVVGVVEDGVERRITEGPAPQAFTAYWQDPAQVDARLSVRTSGDAGRLLPALRSAVEEVDPRVPVTETETMEARRTERFAAVRLAGRMLEVSSGLALFLSAVGLYGILALAVGRRTREIGVRMALGGSRGRIVVQVVREALALVALALGCGLVAAFAVGGALAHELYGVGPRDPATLLAACVLVALVAGLASWWPARRASRVDPLVALRCE